MPNSFAKRVPSRIATNLSAYLGDDFELAAARQRDPFPLAVAPDEVAGRQDVAVDQHEAADTRPGELHGDLRAYRAAADDRDLRGLEQLVSGIEPNAVRFGEHGVVANQLPHARLAEHHRDMDALSVEQVRVAGYDGVTFRSSVAGGQNLCVFSPVGLKFLEGSATVLEVTKVEYGTAPAALVDATNAEDYSSIDN